MRERGEAFRRFAASVASAMRILESERLLAEQAAWIRTCAVLDLGVSKDEDIAALVCLLS